jgi:hypothetical protein
MTTSAAILCESLGPPVHERRPLSPGAWTCVGVLSIPLWATWPANPTFLNSLYSRVSAEI